MRKVVKFGGSSLASAEQFEKVGKIIRADCSRAYVVPVSYTHLDVYKRQGNASFVPVFQQNGTQV